MRLLTIALLMGLSGGAQAFDLQGHRGARGLAPENTLEGFKAALAIGVTTLELDLTLAKDVAVISHDQRLNPDFTRGPDGKFLDTPGPAIRTLRLEELQRYDIGRVKPGSAYAATFPEQKPVDSARIPTLDQLFKMVRDLDAQHVRFNIETKLRPDSERRMWQVEKLAGTVIKLTRQYAVSRRSSLQSFDWRPFAMMRRLGAEIERVCLTAESLNFDTIQRGKPGPSPWLAGLDVDNFDGSVPRLVQAAGCQVWSPLWRNATPEDVAAAKALGLKVIPWTVNERADMERLIALGVDGLITDYPDRLRVVMQEKGMPLPPQVAAR